MKTLTLALMLLPLSPATAFAQATTPAPAPAAAPSASKPTAEPLDADASIETIYASPAGKAVLDRELPKLAEHPSYEIFKTMSLRQVAGFSEGKITDEKVTKIDTALKAIK